MTAVFVVHGLLFASWTAHIPDVKAHLGLTDGTLGFALLGAPVGSVVAMIAASWLLPRVGSRPVVRVALVGYCAAGPLIGLTGSLAALFAALFAWGAFQGTLDVAMNTQGIAVERTRAPEPLMSGLHGSWSIGAFAGAGIGALAVAAGITLSLQLLVMGTVALLVARTALHAGSPRTAAAGHPANADTSADANANASAAGRRGARPRRAAKVSRWSGGMVLLGAIAFASMLCEGAIADWGAVYLSGPLHASGVVPGLGYTAFSTAIVPSARYPDSSSSTASGRNGCCPLCAAVATARIRGGARHRQPARRPGRVLLPRHRPRLGGSGRVQRRGPDTRPVGRNGRGHRVGLRMGGIRVRPAADRPAGVMGVAAGRARPAAAADRVRRGRHAQLARAARRWPRPRTEHVAAR